MKLNYTPPKHYEYLLRQAKLLRLSCPEGRALKTCNRLLWGLYARWDDPDTGELVVGQTDRKYAALRLMRSMKYETAARWLAHFQAGGSLRALCYSREDWKRIDKAARQASCERVRGLYGPDAACNRSGCSCRRK